MGDSSEKKSKKSKKEKKEKKEKKSKRERDARASSPSKKQRREAPGAAAAAGADAPAPAPAPPAWRAFSDAPFAAETRAALAAAGFDAPSEIQQRAWPVACAGDDLIAIAKTGSGKTLAFLLPVFHRLRMYAANDASTPHRDAAAASTTPPRAAALVLAPTRELALQIHREAETYGACEGVDAVAVYGGAPMRDQIEKLRASARRSTIVVATPGRLCDLMKQGAVTLAQCRHVVLDEADRMLDMGFEPQLREVFAATPPPPGPDEYSDRERASMVRRQTLLFSATWPKSVRKMADAFLAKKRKASGDGKAEEITTCAAVTIFLGGGGANVDALDRERELQANASVTQSFIHATDDEKDQRMYDFLCTLQHGSRVVAFANTKRRCETLAKTFWDQGFGVVAVHGDKPQRDREKALADFASDVAPLMFATDVAARGLDIKGVTHVVNYDMARDVESYVHRIGRTGRAGATGESVTFWNPDYDKECAPALCKLARDAGQAVPEWLEKWERGKESKQWRKERAVMKPESEGG